MGAFSEIATPLTNIASNIALLAKLFTGPFVPAPAHSNSTGSPGQIAYDGSWFYVCIATNTWARVAIGGSW